MLGGVAIAITVLMLAPAIGYGPRILPVVIGGGLMFLVGLADDLVSMKPSTKLIAEIAVASFFVGLAMGGLFVVGGDLGGPIAAHFLVNYLNLHYIAKLDGK